MPFLTGSYSVIFMCHILLYIIILSYHITNNAAVSVIVHISLYTSIRYLPPLLFQPLCPFLTVALSTISHHYILIPLQIEMLLYPQSHSDITLHSRTGRWVFSIVQKMKCKLRELKWICSRSHFLGTWGSESWDISELSRVSLVL